MRVFPAWGLDDEHLFDIVDLGLIPGSWTRESKDPIADSSFLRFMEEHGVNYASFYWAARAVNPTPEEKKKYNIPRNEFADRLTVYVPKSVEGLREKVEEKWGDKFSTTA